MKKKHQECGLPKLPTVAQLRAARAKERDASLQEKFPGGAEQIAAQVKAARQAQTRAERDRVALLGRSDGSVVRGNDTGVGLQVERDRVEIRRDALVPLDPDVRNGPAQRGVRGQRVWAPDRLLQRGTITGRQHYAAERYLDDFEVGHEGAKDRSLVVITRDTGGAPLPGPSDRQLNAMTRYRTATQRVGQTASGVLLWCVLRAVPPDRAPTVEAFARTMGPGWTTDRAVGLLIGALDALVAFYGVSAGDQGGGGGRRRHTIAGHAGHGPPPTPRKREAMASA